MGLGSTAKKLQQVADAAEKLFEQLSDLRERVTALENDLQTTADRVGEMEREQRRQRALLEAVAETRGVDVEAVLAAAEEQMGGDGAKTPVSEDAGSTDEAATDEDAGSADETATDEDAGSTDEAATSDA
ncbi:MAG: DUF5798 family protein [Halobacteriales archaeon]